MKTVTGTTALVLMCALFFMAQGKGSQANAPGLPPDSHKPGDIERAALAKVDFLVGEWEGEGWSLTRSGQRERFWVMESYRYRGDKDLMDMEGRFGDILPDGTNSTEQRYALGILFYDRGSREYRMWHYSDDGEVFSVKMDVDIKGRAAQYTREYPGIGPGRFGLAIGEDGIWVTTVEILRPDKTWLKVMEFRMKRIAK